MYIVHPLHSQQVLVVRITGEMCFTSVATAVGNWVN